MPQGQATHAVDDVARLTIPEDSDCDTDVWRCWLHASEKLCRCSALERDEATADLAHQLVKFLIKVGRLFDAFFDSTDIRDVARQFDVTQARVYQTLKELGLNAKDFRNKKATIDSLLAQSEPFRKLAHSVVSRMTEIMEETYLGGDPPFTAEEIGKLKKWLATFRNRPRAQRKSPPKKRARTVK